MQTEFPPFQPGRNEPCFCGSGQRFKRCCGDTGSARKPPCGIAVREQFLDAAECDDIMAVARLRPATRLMVLDKEKTSATEVVRKLDGTRVTMLVDMGEQQALLDGLVERAIREVIEPDTGARFDWFEKPQLLRYEPGGFYSRHADNANFLADRNCWKRELDRDTSMLLYLDQDFSGGEIVFNRFDFSVKPRRGMLIHFPSDHRYEHTAMPVTAGIRHAVVSWLSRTGVEKLRPPAEGAVLLRPD